LTPQLVERVVYAAAETRSFQRAAIALERIADNPLSAKTIERVAQEVGQELAALRDAPDGGLARESPAPPALAVVECDGGRLRTRQPEQGPGVHRPAWRETKNACLVRMTRQSFAEDPHPELPRAFRDPQRIAELAEKEPCSSLSPPPEAASAEEPDRPDWRPRRVMRTCLASLAPSHEFGVQMESEARQRGFFEAPAQAFLGDGLAWNWSIWEERFPHFTPILDFIHVLGYLYPAALAL
jgi:hypothetical protein